MHATTVPSSIMMAYMMREEVEFLHDGQAEQHRLQAADPQQHASCKQKMFKDFVGEKHHIYFK